jgi:hypothetical protein
MPCHVITFLFVRKSTLSCPLRFYLRKRKKLKFLYALIEKESYNICAINCEFIQDSFRVSKQGGDVAFSFPSASYCVEICVFASP